MLLYTWSDPSVGEEEEEEEEGGGAEDEDVEGAEGGRQQGQGALHP